MAEYRERLNYGEMAKDTIEIGGGFIVSGFTGRLIEEKLRPNVMPTSPTSEKIIAGIANNLPKVGLYYIFNKIGMKGAAAAAMGSLGYDALIRATNEGVNPVSIYVKNYRILNQESLNNSPQTMQQPQSTPDWAERQKQFGAMPFRDNPGIIERQHRFGTMPFDQPVEKTDRQHKYGFAGTMERMGFVPDSKETSIARMFNMK